MYAHIDGLAASVDAADCDVYYLPFLYGTNAHPLAKATFAGLTSYHTKAHMLRAVYEGVAYSHRTHIERLLSAREAPKAIRMVGRTVGDYYNRQVHTRGTEMLRVEGLSRKGEFHDISFSAYAGEILGISGLVGAGRTEVMETVFGARKADSGKVFVNGEEVNFTSPRDAIRHKIGMVTEDRRRTGLMLKTTVKTNMVLPSVSMHATRFGFANRIWESNTAIEMVRKLRVKTPSIDTVIGNLSGGNQQKVILAKWLVAESNILILDEPTRGIDVNAKSEFYALMNDFVARGGCIIMVSSEMPEIIGISDRVLVMREGHISGELSVDEINEHSIIKLASISSNPDCA